LLFDELVVLTRKPVHIKFDAQNRTHCDNDYAIKYPDNTGVAIWHGQMIPPEWIFDKSTITPDVLLHWKNIEQRRCSCEIIGWSNVLKLLNSKVIDKDPDPTIGTLLEVELPDSGNEKFLLALDPNTNKEVGLPVPNEMKTALEANSWTYNIPKFEFKPDFRV
jgi:internalin A